MNIKSLLLGSAAALAAVSGAQAADAIVAAEPEPMEYVRVCDAFGTGYFYIPGTETCLKIGGWVRAQVNFGPNVGGRSDWDASGRGYVYFDTKNDTEYGTLAGFIALEGDVDNSTSASVNPYIDEAYLSLGGFKAGYFYNFWDKGINGETDSLGSNDLNAVQYVYDGGSFQVGGSIDELEDNDGVGAYSNGIGVEAIATVSLGGVSFDLLGGYDTELEEGAVRGLLSADVGPGTLQVAAIYASDPNAYFSTSEWTVAASYAYKATDKLTITPAAQYWSDLAFVDGVDQWRAGVTVAYAITDGLRSLVSVRYTDPDGADDFVDGFVRLQRDF